MGMFDDVVCEVELPDGYEGRNFQTKDLECGLTTYKITTEGRLLRREYEWVKSEGAPLGMRREPRDWTDANYHGILNFYGGGLKSWHEYEAKFTDGKLVEIKQIGREV